MATLQRTISVSIPNTSKKTFSYSEAVAALPDQYKEILARDVIRNQPYLLSTYKWLFTQSRHFLDVRTHSILMFIVGRTIGYYKRAELISLDQFLNGVWDNSGKSISAPAVDSKDALYAGLTVLISMGLVSRTLVYINGVRNMSVYCIHPELFDNYVATEINTKLRVPKTLRNVPTANSVLEEIGSNNNNLRLKSKKPIYPKSGNKEHNKQIYNKHCNELINTTGCSADASNVLRVPKKPRQEKVIATDFTLREIASAAVARSTNRRAARISTVSNKLTLSSLNATWKQCIIDQYGHARTTVGLTGKDFGILKKIVKAHDLSIDWPIFLSWCVLNWVRLDSTYRQKQEYAIANGGSGKVTGLFLSPAPDIGQVVRKLLVLVRLFNDGSASLSNDDSEQVRELKKENTRIRAALADIVRLKAKPSSTMVTTGRKAARSTVDLDDCDLPDSLYD